MVIIYETNKYVQEIEPQDTTQKFFDKKCVNSYLTQCRQCAGIQ